MIFHDFFIGLEVIMVNVALHEEVLNFKRIKFLFGFYQFQWKNIFLFGDKRGRLSLLECANFGQKHSDLSVHLIDIIKLIEELFEVLFLGPEGLLGLNIVHFDFSDLFHFVYDDFLAKSALAALIVKLMNDFFLELMAGSVSMVVMMQEVWLEVCDVSELMHGKRLDKCLYKCMLIW